MAGQEDDLELTQLSEYYGSESYNNVIEKMNLIIRNILIKIN